MRSKDLRRQDFYDVHHTYWPRRLYKGDLEARFRNLACNKVTIHRSEHNRIHAEEQPPQKPSRLTMLAVLDLHKTQSCPICHKEVDDERPDTDRQL